MADPCPACGRQRHSGEDPTSAESPTVDVHCPVCNVDSLATTPAETITGVVRPQVRSPMIGQFKLIQLLGSGGFGEVWKAEDTKLGRLVALKLSKPSSREASTLLFEAKTAASLRHPHIVSIYEVGNEKGTLFIASELIDGMTLRDLLSTGKLTLKRILELMIPICRALQHAHQKGVVHRDIKPANILIDQLGQPFVADFGIAKRINASDNSSDEGKIIGTARYMSPEQAAGKTGLTDHRSDIYSLGVMLFEMLTGESPFRGNARALVHQKITEEPPSPRVLDPNLPKDVETICLKCLEREPSKRFASAQELAEELTRLAAGEPIRSRPITRVERSWRWCRRHSMVSGLALGLFLSLSGGLLGVSYFWMQSDALANSALRSLYRSKMNQVATRYRDGDTHGAREILAEIEKHPRLAALRGFDWRYHHEITAGLQPIANLGAPVGQIVCSGNGEFCAALGSDREVRVWNTKEKKLVRELAEDQTGIRTLALSPSTITLAIGTVDGHIRLYEPLANASVVRQIQNGPPVALLRYSHDGRYLAAAGKTGAVRLWETRDYRLVAEIPTGKRGETRTLCFSKSGRLYVGSEDGHVRVWDPDQVHGADAVDVPVPEQELDLCKSLEALAISDDGQWVVAGDFAGNLTVLREGAETPERHSLFWGRISGLEFVPHANMVIGVAMDGQAHCFDLTLKREIGSLRTHAMTDGALTRSKDGGIFLVGGGDGAVVRFQFQKPPKPAVLWHPHPVRQLAFLRGDSRLLASYENGEMRIWDIVSGVATPLSETTPFPGRVFDLHPDGNLLACGDAAKQVNLWNVENRKIEAEISAAPTGASIVRFSSNGKRLAISVRKTEVKVFESANWKAPMHRWEADETVNALAFTQAEDRLAIASKSNQVVIHSLDQNAKPQVIRTEAEPTAVQFCEADQTLVIATSLGELVFWDLVQDRLTSKIRAHTGRINTLNLLSGNGLLVSAGYDRSVKLWDVPSRELVSPLWGHFHQVFAVATASDGQTMASGGLDGDIQLWRGLAP